MPERLWEQARVECEITDRHVTIIEARPPWDGSDREWTRFPIARLRYTASTGLWSLYWRDRNLKFHIYEGKDPTKSVQSLLDHIGSSGDPIFWG